MKNANINIKKNSTNLVVSESTINQVSPINVESEEIKDIESIQEETTNSEVLEPKSHCDKTDIMKMVEKDLETLRANGVEVSDKAIFNEDEMVNAMDMINDDITEIPSLVKGLFPQVGLVGLIGTSDVGKSSFCRHLAVSIITGRKFLYWDVNPIHKKVVYISTEDNRYSISPTLKNSNKDHNLMPEEFKGLNYIFTTEDLLERMDNYLEKNPCDLVIMDVFTDIFNDDLNKAIDVRKFMQKLHEQTIKHNCLALSLNHVRKGDEEKAASKNNSVGSQSFEAKLRVVLELQNTKFRPGIKEISIVKGNYISQDDKNKKYYVEFTENYTYKIPEVQENLVLIDPKVEKIEKLSEDYNTIKGFKSEGNTHRVIGEKMGISHTYVGKIIKNYEALTEEEKKLITPKS